jgi:cellulose synthase operon protein C
MTIPAAKRAWLAATAVLLCSVLHRAAAQPADDATQQYAAATAIQKRGEFGQAARQWTEFIRNHSSDERIARAHYYLGVCYYEEGNFPEAMRLFEKAIAKYPQSDLLEATQLHLGLAQLASAQAGKREMYARAAGTFQDLVAKHPQGDHIGAALYCLGESLRGQGKKTEAMELYSQLVEKYPRHKFAPDALYALGLTQEESADRRAAVETYEKFLARFAEHRLAAEVTMRLGEALIAEGRQTEAAKRFADAAARTGFAMADYAALRRADAAADQKQYQQAAALYAELPANFPRSEHLPRAWLGAGRSLCLAGRYAEAREALTKAVAAGGPVVAEAAHWLAQSFLKDNQPAQAIAVVEKNLPRAAGGPWAVRLLLDRADAMHEIPERRSESAALYGELAAKYPREPTAAQSLYMAGYAALESNQPAKALACAEKFFEAHPDHELTADALCVAAESRLQLGKWADAEAAFGRLIEKYPEHSGIRLWKLRRAVLLHAEKKYEETILALEPILGELQSREQSAEAHYLVGSSRLELKQFDAAIKSLGASLEAQPTWRQADQACLELAEAYRRAGDLEQAQATARRLVEQYPQSRLLALAWFRLGTYRTMAGATPAAITAYRKVIDQWPASPLVPGALHELGCAQLSQNEPAAAEVTFNSLLAKKPSPDLAVRARHARAMARQRQGKSAEALDDLQAVLAAGPPAAEKSDARLLAGVCQVELKQFDKAAATLRSLLDEDPKYVRADRVLHQLGAALRGAGREAEASKALARLAADFPQSRWAAEAQFNVGELRFQNKDYAAASQAFFAIAGREEKTPLAEQATYKLGLCYYHERNFADAQKSFAYQLSRYPEGPLAPSAAFMAAESLFQQGMFAEAMTGYAKLKDLPDKSSQATALVHSGQAAAELGRWSESAERLEQAVRQFPDSPHVPDALFELGRARQNLDMPKEALAAYERVIAKTDGEMAARAQLVIGKMQLAANDPKQAVKSFFKVLYGYSAAKWQAEAAFEAGRALETLGDKPQAVKIYRELLDKFPASDKAASAKERLGQLK